MNASAKMASEGIWKKHSEAWKVSGLSQQAYCTQEGLSYKRFVYQHNRIQAHSKKTSVKFIEAQREPAVTNNQASGLQLMLPNGIRIGLGAEVNATLLQTVLNVAGAVPCLN